VADAGYGESLSAKGVPEKSGNVDTKYLICTPILLGGRVPGRAAKGSFRQRV
jgi:hypothetical protein